MRLEQGWFIESKYTRTLKPEFQTVNEPSERQHTFRLHTAVAFDKPLSCKGDGVVLTTPPASTTDLRRD